MITDKQKQRDYEYEADYQSKSRYTAEQWTNILKSGQLEEDTISLLKEIYSSFNHAATLLSLAFHRNETESEILEKVNLAGKFLGETNSLNPEVDYDGNEYWWFLFFWGKNTKDNTLELKLHPELAEAIGGLWEELEEAYYAFMNDVNRSLQIRYTQEDAVWIAAAVLLYEKYYRNPGISADDILLMQYEVQTRSQKVYGQDVNANTITQICNADERGHRFNYLRDIYKYYRVSYPGEFEGERERPDPTEVDYNAYIYSVFGYMTLNDLTDFIDHEYAHLVDESYIELSSANGFVALATFLTRKGGNDFSPDDASEQSVSIRTQGEDGTALFHKIGDGLLQEYPNFVYAKKGDWYLPETGKITEQLEDLFFMESYSSNHAFISIRTITDGDVMHVETALNLPCIPDEEVMLDIHDKCNMLTLMTAAPFQVSLVPMEKGDLLSSGDKIKASVLYHYDTFKTLSEEDILGLFGTSLEIFASYYTDICQNYYPSSQKEEDPLAAALGSKLTYRPAADVPGPQVIYKEGGISPKTEYITKTIQSYGTSSDTDDMESSSDKTETTSFVNKDLLEEEEDDIPVKKHSSSPGRIVTAASSSGRHDRMTGESSQIASIPSSSQESGNSKTVTSSISPDKIWPPVKKTTAVSHDDRKDQTFRLYPKNTLIRGPVKSGKFHQAILTAVGIIEGKDPNMMKIEPVPDVLEHYRNYEDEGRILHISYPDINGEGYSAFIERKRGPFIENGIFKEFANRCGEGRYVVMMEETDASWMHLFGETAVLLRENRREGASSETAITLSLSGEKFRLPANLYIVATCDSIVCEDTILGAIDHDFFIRPVCADAEVLHGMRVEGISLQRLMTTLNTRISYFLGADYQLGEGFFLQSPDKDSFISLCRVFREQIIPLLEKWFDGDMERIRYVLGDNAKRRSDTVFFQEISFRDGLFKGNLPDDFDKGRHIYRINEEAFYNPKSYTDIYEG
ncbi:MAG: hypothetical protein MR867_00385 [Eubacterium sp.]|nr:hypothetical protein [Eubacterium sp.]MDD7209270.1 hypothetical protein [Lachnospiraceae bacterium]